MDGKGVRGAWSGRGSGCGRGWWPWGTCCGGSGGREEEAGRDGRMDGDGEKAAY